MQGIESTQLSTISSINMSKSFGWKNFDEACEIDLSVIKQDTNLSIRRLPFCDYLLGKDDKPILILTKEPKKNGYVRGYSSLEPKILLEELSKLPDEINTRLIDALELKQALERLQPSEINSLVMPSSGDRRSDATLLSALHEARPTLASGSRKSELRLTDITKLETKNLRELEAEGITVCELPSLEQFCKTRNLQIAELNDYIQTLIPPIKASISSSIREGGVHKELFEIFELYKALENTEPGNASIDSLKAKLVNLRSFEENFIGDLTPRQRKRLSSEVSGIQDFTWQRSSIYIPKDRRSNLKVYRSSPDIESERWIKADENSRVTVYMTEKAYTEAAKNKSNPLKGNLLFHFSSTGALPGLEKYNALLSRDQINELEDVKSGEGTDLSPRVYVFDTFDSIYDKRKWFDQYPLGIVFKKSDVEDLIESSAPDHGISLGRVVPLTQILQMWTLSKNAENLRAWCAQYAPQAEVHTYEERPLVTF